MRLRAAGLVPPIWLVELLMSRMPLPLPCPPVPAAFVPMKLPAITWPPEFSGWMPAPLKRLITSPRTVDEPAVEPSVRPIADRRGAVQLDEKDGVIARGQRVRAGAWLRVAVNRRPDQ